MTLEEVDIRTPTERDGGDIWRAARDAGTLDVNAPYSYLLLGKHFGGTSAVAKRGGKTVGFVTGFRPPGKPDTWFVWQIGVDAEARGQGIGRRLLEHVLGRPDNADIRYLEATVSPSNAASRSLFFGLARSLGLDCDISEGFPAELFPDGAHEKEELYRIGPFTYQS
ncbi:diaminobutyrate acetyltransferase [Paenibacillus sp.]|uniref:diaminobutyrate acetyltransferase n=1 Tax=Paenibacillus sp. TaxID=58172 RepID=UPI00281133CD|nr:diaminobutyrate acetyltransferase [Paenibacillus sp.]